MLTQGQAKEILTQTIGEVSEGTVLTYASISSVTILRLILVIINGNNKVYDTTVVTRCYGTEAWGLNEQLSKRFTSYKEANDYLIALKG